MVVPNPSGMHPKSPSVCTVSEVVLLYPWNSNESSSLEIPWIPVDADAPVEGTTIAITIDNDRQHGQHAFPE